jgi:hypothetical protein
MRAPLLIFLAAGLLAASGLAIMNNACTSGYRTWCDPTSGIRHHLKTAHSSNAGGAADPETAKPAPSKASGSSGLQIMICWGFDRG